MVDYYTELNYGSITNTATTLENHGDISHGVATNVDYGHIWIVSTQYSFLPALKVIGKTSWKATEAFVGDGRNSLGPFSGSALCRLIDIIIIIIIIIIMKTRLIIIIITL